MDSRRIRNLRNSFDRNIVDKQVDKIFETGRQFVDGVSGARPGKRRNSDFQGITSTVSYTHLTLPTSAGV